MTKEEILDYLREQKPVLRDSYSISQIGLYGSFSRGEQNDQSDIDIIYHLAQGKKLSYYQLFEIESAFENHFNRKVEMVNLKYMNPLIRFIAEKEIIYV